MIKGQASRRYVVMEDISLINNALASGYDVAIKRTENGVKIIQEQARVLKRKNVGLCEQEKTPRQQNQT